jgi:hypothetical protein
LYDFERRRQEHKRNKNTAEIRLPREPLHSNLLDKTVILIVGTNPKPSNSIRFEQANGSVSQTNPNRIKWLGFFYTLEEKARMRRIVAPQRKRAAPFGEFLEAKPNSASRTIWSCANSFVFDKLAVFIEHW